MTVREVGFRGGVGDELAAVGAALERFVSRPRGERLGEVVRDEMVGWRRLIDRMELEFSGMVTELAACGEEEWQGHNSPTDWGKEECHLTRTGGRGAPPTGSPACRSSPWTSSPPAGRMPLQGVRPTLVPPRRVLPSRPLSTSGRSSPRPGATPSLSSATTVPFPPRRRPPPLPRRAGRARGGALPGAQDG